MLDINEIKKIIPHRYPFLLVDRIEEMEPGVKAVGYKNVTANEPFFQGHFPEYPVIRMVFSEVISYLKLAVPSSTE